MSLRRSILGAAVVLSLGSLVFGWIGLAWVVLLVGWAIARRNLKGLDDLLFEGEKAIVCLALVAMSLAVFVDVVWRTAHSLEGNQPIGFAAAIFALTMIGAFTAKWPGASAVKRAVAGLAAYLLMAAACVAIYSAPNGFGWSQTLAMVLLLWVGLIGSSMATKQARHIAVDAVKRVLPERFRKAFELAAGFVAVALSAFLTVLAIRYCRQNFLDWMASDQRSFVFESLPIPYWVATLPIPIGFGLTAARFVTAALHGTKEVDVITSVGGAELEAKP